ncbi:MAG: OadG family protein [Spirochaeta sp.]|jgi:oxaloacetate decarboxylase gamma subunit|nr:OadG family protein [Spirochaeta sp.]
MIAAGLQLMVLGMSIVFVFLILLVFLMALMGALVRRFAPAPATGASAGGQTAASGTASSPAGSFDTHIPAVLAAVAAHRARTRHAAQVTGASAPNTTTT